MGGNKYAREVLKFEPSEDQDQDKPKEIANIESQAIVPQEPIFFNGKKILFSPLEQIENTQGGIAYLKFIPGVDISEEKLFENQTSRLHFGSHCLQHLSFEKNNKLYSKFMVNGKEINALVTHELKSKRTDDRILVACLVGDQDVDLYLAFKYVEGGWHNTASFESTCESIRKSPPLALDFLISQENKLDALPSLKR